jgi:hypothetical protein
MKLRSIFTLGNVQQLIAPAYPELVASTKLLESYGLVLDESCEEERTIRNSRMMTPP